MSNIVFMGTPQFAVPILKKINQKYKINCVLTQPPSKSNRGQKFMKSPIHKCAEELNLKIKKDLIIKKLSKQKTSNRVVV